MDMSIESYQCERSYPTFKEGMDVDANVEDVCTGLKKMYQFVSFFFIIAGK